VLQGLLKRFYSSQMEALAEREIEKAASGPAVAAERVVEIADRYPYNPSILKRAIAAFENWARSRENAKLLCTDRVVGALIQAAREPARAAFAREKCGVELCPLVVGLLAFVTLEHKGCRLLVKAGFLEDCATLLGTGWSP
jgi:hypothetical protein